MKKIPSTIESYLQQIENGLREELGKNFIGLYVGGSVGFNDFQEVHSDLDLIAISNTRLHRSVKKSLKKSFPQFALPCPVSGIELHIIQKKTAKHPSIHPAYESVIRIGNQWKFTAEFNHYDSDLLLDMHICRVHGYRVSGRSIREVFGSIPRVWILDALRNSLHWRQKNLFHPFHDPYGENAILNACRAWHYKEKDRFCSKTEAGEWAIQQTQNNEIIQKALDIRHERSQERLNRNEVRLFVQNVKYSLGTTLHHRLIHWFRNHF